MIRNGSESKWVNGYEGKYEISKVGKLYRHFKNGNIKSIGSQSVHGYITATLSNGKHPADNASIHRLVAQAFIDNPEFKEFVDHIDEDKTNNNVENLRWCTHIENVEYYATFDGRNHHTKLRQQHKAAMKAKELELKEEKRTILSLIKKIEKAESELAIEKEKFEDYKEEIHKKIKLTSSVYSGYKDTTGVKFDTKEEKVALTGKPICVNGKKFASCGEAASFVVAEEGRNGFIRMKSTVSKEMRRFLQGQRKGIMYGKRYELSAA